MLTSTNTNQSHSEIVQADPTNPSWLTQQLRTVGMLDNDHYIQSLESKTIGEEVGFLSETKVMNLNYNDDQPHLLHQLLLKETTKNPQFKEVGESLNAFEREILFYQNLAPSFPIRLPHVYFTQLNSHHKLLAMEYLSSLEGGDQVKGLTHRQVQNIIENIGKLHAHFWQDESLESLSWLLKDSARMSQTFNDNFDNCIVLATPIIGIKGVKLFQQIQTNFDWMIETVKHRPYTLVHNDLRADNILLNPDNEKEPMILDWQLAGRSMGAFDIARLVGGSEINVQRKGHQLELVRLWHQVLINNGVSNYSIDDAWFDFKLASLYFVILSIRLYGYGQNYMRKGGRAAKLFPTMVQRFFDNAIETSALDILQ